MSALESRKEARKRIRNGREKLQHNPAPQNETPPCAQAAKNPDLSSISVGTANSSEPKQQDDSANVEQSAPSAVPKQKQSRPSHAQKQKLPRLPDNVRITKRPIRHPALPSPFSSSASPKSLYVRSTTPFIPTIKRIRHLLTQAEKRDHQSQRALAPTFEREPLTANGRLNHKTVEQAIVEASGGDSRRRRRGGGGGGGEEVFVKATGKAIPRALELGNWFQRGGEWKVRVEIGSVKAIDELFLAKIEDVVEDGGQEADVDPMDIDAADFTGRGRRRKKKKGKMMPEDEVPETRVRSVSTVTVAISSK